MNRVSFLIDGFNLYHSLRDASSDLGGVTTKWLNIRSLCKSYLHLLKGNAQFQHIFYFSALAEHLVAHKPDVVNRHKKYIQCLEDVGIEVKLGRFKEKRFYHHGSLIVRHEEKETDINIAIKLINLCYRDLCDTIIVISGDTDLMPAIKAVNSDHNNKDVGVIFPYKRKNIDLMGVADFTFKIKQRKYLNHQFDNPHELEDGTKVYKPQDW